MTALGQVAMWLLGVTFLFATACGPRSDVDSVVPAVPELADLEAHSVDQLIGALQLATHRAKSVRSGRAKVSYAHLAGRLARALLRRGTGREQVEAAVQLLERVVAEPGLPGLCDVSWELAVLELDYSGDGRSASRIAARAYARFADTAAAEDCLRRLDELRLAVGPGREGGPGSASTPPLRTGRGAPRKLEAVARPAILQRVQVYGAGQSNANSVRTVLYFDREVAYRAGLRRRKSDDVQRLAVDLSATSVAPTVRSSTQVGRGGLTALRVFRRPEGAARAEFELESDARYQVFHLANPYRVVVDVVRKRADGGARQFRVVLDPGHGGKNPGAKGPTGLRESDVALSLARRVRARLRSLLPAAEVFLTRDADVAVSLEERAGIANALDADVFVSIHLNASGDPAAKGGVTTFVLDTTGDEQALRLAARENGSEVADVGGLQAVIANLHRQGQVDRSLQLAKKVHRRTLTRARALRPALPDRGVKKALFYVLVGVGMPAILLEASFITRPDEEAALRDSRYRDALAGGVARGIVDYLAGTR